MNKSIWHQTTGLIVFNYPTLNLYMQANQRLDTQINENNLQQLNCTNNNKSIYTVLQPEHYLSRVGILKHMLASLDKVCPLENNQILHAQKLKICLKFFSLKMLYSINDGHSS